MFLHEGLGSLTSWKDIPAQLVEATGCGAIVYSRAGYGRSDPIALPRPVRFMHDEANVLGEVLLVAGIREAVLVGHSDGASIAIIHASQPAVPLLGLVLEAPHVFVEPIGLESIALMTDRYRNDTDFLRRLRRRHGKNTECAFRGWNDVWLHADFRRWNIEEFLPAISAPMLILQGADDPYGTWAQVEAIRRQASVPVEAHLLAECGHAPHKDRPDIVLPEIASFTRRVTSE